VMQGSELEEGGGEEDEDSDGSEESDPESEGANEVSEEGENDEEDEAVVDEEEEEEESGNGVLEGAFGCGNDLETRRYAVEHTGVNRGAPNSKEISRESRHAGSMALHRKQALPQGGDEDCARQSDSAERV